MSTQSNARTSVAVHRPCPNCGHELEFSAGRRALFCSHCETSSKVTGLSGDVCKVNCFFSALARLDAKAEWPEQLILGCENCGAEITLPENVLSDRCSYCDSPVYAAHLSVRPLRPEAVLPFKIDRDLAGRHFRHWLGSRWFLPGKVKTEARVSRFNGIYLPHWCYNSKADTAYTGMRGDYYYVTVEYTETVNGKEVKKTREERRTRWTSVAGTVFNDFRDLLIRGDHALPPELVDELEPWDLGNLQPYHPDFIRGYRERNYSVPLARGFECAKAIMGPRIRQTVLVDIGGDEQRITGADSRFRDITFRLLLMPCWENHFEFQGKKYVFLVNARTGEVQGVRPWSTWKILFFVLFMAALFAGLAWLITSYA